MLAILKTFGSQKGQILEWLIKVQPILEIIKIKKERPHIHTWRQNNEISLSSNQVTVSESPVNLEKYRISDLLHQKHPSWFWSSQDVELCSTAVDRVRRKTTRNGIGEWELDQCKFCGQNRISAGVIFLKCIVRLVWSIQAYPTELKHFLRLLKSATIVQVNRKLLLYAIRSPQERQ